MKTVKELREIGLTMGGIILYYLLMVKLVDNATSATVVKGKFRILHPFVLLIVLFVETGRFVISKVAKKPYSFLDSQFKKLFVWV